MNGRRYDKLWRLLAAVAVVAAVSGCGKKAGLEPPEGQEGTYTYPRVYPNPETVLPSKDKKSESPTYQAPPFAGGLSPFPQDRTTTTTYQSAPAQ